MATKYWLGNDTGNEGKLNVAANWSPVGVPGAADDVIFDGRSTEDADDDLDVWAALDLGSLTVRPSFTKNIGEYSAGVSESTDNVNRRWYGPDKRFRCLQNPVW